MSSGPASKLPVLQHRQHRGRPDGRGGHRPDLPSSLRARVYGPPWGCQTPLPAAAVMPPPFLHGYHPKPTGPEDLSRSALPPDACASGGLVSTPSDLNDFVRGSTPGGVALRPRGPRQLRVRRGGSEPPGPRTNSAGAGIFRYRTRCGTVYGHTGQHLRLHPVPRRDAERQALGHGVGQRPAEPRTPTKKVFRLLLHADGKAVCAALAR